MIRAYIRFRKANIILVEVGLDGWVEWMSELLNSSLPSGNLRYIICFVNGAHSRSILFAILLPISLAAQWLWVNLLGTSDMTGRYARLQRYSNRSIFFWIWGFGFWVLRFHIRILKNWFDSRIWHFWDYSNLDYIGKILLRHCALLRHMSLINCRLRWVCHQCATIRWDRGATIWKMHRKLFWKLWWLFVLLT